MTWIKSFISSTIEEELKKQKEILDKQYDERMDKFIEDTSELHRLNLEANLKKQKEEIIGKIDDLDRFVLRDGTGRKVIFYEDIKKLLQ